MLEDENLRRELDAACKIRIPAEYQQRLDDLKARFDHSILVLPEGRGEIRRFNCFAYAFGVWNNPRYDCLVDRTQSSVLIDSALVMEMLNRGDLIEVATPRDEPSVVFYFSGEKLMHAGCVKAVSGDLIITIHSKWGGNEVHEHKLWEVPLEYGDRVRFFQLPAAGTVLDQLEADHKTTRS
jgi:hypothetical protein